MSGPKTVSPKKTGSMPALTKIAVSPSSNILTLRSSAVLFSSS